MDKKLQVVTYDYFINKFVPSPAGKKEPTEKLSVVKGSFPLKPENPQTAKDMLDGINEWIKGADNTDNENSRWDGSGYKIVVTANKADPDDPTKQRADLALLYPSHSAPSTTDAPKWSAVEVFIECKPQGPTTDDPFSDKAGENFQPLSIRRRENLGQIMSYASLVFDHQHRKYQFSVVLFGDMARIVRWDRAGVVATERFDYRQEPLKLGRFFWRLCHMSVVQRGHDPSVEEVHTDSYEYKLMCARAQNPIFYENTRIELQNHARLLFAESLRTAKMCYKIKVPDGNGERSFLVGAPHFLSSEPAGRGTRGYVAVDCSKDKKAFYYLKDAWRVAHNGIEREGDVLKYLNDEKVFGVPTLECHGDLEGQVTESQKVWKVHHEPGEACPFKTHHHYRIIVKEVGLSMSRFNNGKDLIYLIGTCIKAHREAYQKGVMHCDVSAGNVLIQIKEEVVNGKLVRQRVGMLTDWELSKRVDAPGTARQPDRMGTWQFMGAHILDHPDAMVLTPDEMESFFHVTLFYAIRFLPHNCEDVSQFMHDYFDGSEKANGTYFCGLKKRSAMVEGKIPLVEGKKLEFYLPVDETPAAGQPAPAHPSSESSRTHPINIVFAAMLQCFRARYALMEKPVPSAPTQLPSIPPAPRATFDRMNAFFANGPKSKRPTVKVNTALSPELRMQYENDAANLEDHLAFNHVLGCLHIEAVNWPISDRIGDQLRADFNPKKDNDAAPAPDAAAPPPTTASQNVRTRSARTRSIDMLPTTESGSSVKRCQREDDEEYDDAQAPEHNRSQTKKPRVSRTGSRLGMGGS